MMYVLVRVAAVASLSALLVLCINAVWMASQSPAGLMTPVSSQSVAAQRNTRVSLEGHVHRSLSGYPQTTRRPVFFEGRVLPTRVMPKAEQQVAVRATEQHTFGIEGIHILGISTSAKGVRALLDVHGTSSWYAEGDRVDAWTVQAVRQNSARLVRQGHAATLLLYRFPAEK